MTYSGPLGVLRVLEIATFIAAPFCGTILSDFGAEVIKIEQPGQVIPSEILRPRRLGIVRLAERSPKQEEHDTRSQVSARREDFPSTRRILYVVLENFRPGTLEFWGRR